MAKYLSYSGLSRVVNYIKSLLNSKVDTVDGKGLSTNDYTTTEKNKLSGIASGAEVNVQSDWNVTSTTSDAYIKNKPTIPTNTNQLTNGAGFVTSSGVTSVATCTGLTGGTITGTGTLKVNLKSGDTKINSSSNATVTSITSGRLYPVQTDSSGYLAVHVPWTDDNTTALGSMTGTLAIEHGGTGATTAAAARSNLGLGTAATYSATSSVLSGSNSLITSGAVYTGLAGKADSSHDHTYINYSGSSIDSNEFAGTGLKYASVDSEGSPTDSDGILVFVPYGSDSTSYGHQFYFDDDSNTMYHRSLNGGDYSWNTWRRIYDDEYHPVTVSLNGSATSSPSWYAPTSRYTSTYGGVLYSTSSGAPNWTTAGASGYVLQSNGSGNAPSWRTVTDSTSASAISTNSYLVTERDIYYGLPYVNGSHLYTSSSYYYAPTSVGTSGYFLKSNGSGAPSWSNTLAAATYISSTSYRVVGTSTGYNTKIHVSSSTPSMSVGDLWFKIPA